MCNPVVFLTPVGNQIVKCVIWVGWAEGVDREEGGMKQTSLGRHVEEDFIYTQHILITPTCKYLEGYLCYLLELGQFRTCW